MFKTKIYDCTLDTCIYNASGVHCTSKGELITLYDNSCTGAIVTKSCTLNYREGNELPRYYDNQISSINSTGLANNGVQYYSDVCREIKEIKKNTDNAVDNNVDKPIFISVSGMSLEENLQIFGILNDRTEINYNMIELNLSCPNIVGKPQIGYDFETSNELLRKVFESYDHPIGLKLPPYFDGVHFDLMSDTIKQYPFIKFVTCINSLGNGLIIDPVTESTVIKPKNGLGGIGGSIVKPIALSNVHQFYRRLSNIDIVGCGGVVNGTDVFEHILAGASAVQVGTQLRIEGIKCFDRLLFELGSIMNVKNYGTIDEFKGKLQYL